MPSRPSVPFIMILALSLLFRLFIPVHASFATPEPPCVLRVVDSLSTPGDGSTWAVAYTDLSLAITAASPGCEVWVAQGVYTPGTSPDDSFSLKNNVAIYGGFNGTETERTQRNWRKNITTLDGGMLVYHVVKNTYINPFAVLDGFTITNGNATGTGEEGRGGGVNNNNSNPTLTNLTFSGNTASTGGGMFNYFSNTNLTNVIFSGNTAGYGGGMYNVFSNLTLTNVAFTGNMVVNQGGGMMNDYSSPTLTNVTISGNSAGEIGGGIYNYLSAPLINNSIIWGNTGGGIINIIGTTSPTLTNSLVQGCIIDTIWQPSCGKDGTDNLGGNNLDTDPLFVDANGPDNIFGTADDNPRLMKNSPAIDTGNDSLLPIDTLDMDGDGITEEPTPCDLDMRLRIIGARVDMGSSEFKIETIFLSLISQ
jgi:hypothetical protein